MNTQTNVDCTDEKREGGACRWEEYIGDNTAQVCAHTLPNIGGWTSFFCWLLLLIETAQRREREKQFHLVVADIRAAVPLTPKPSTHHHLSPFVTCIVGQLVYVYVTVQLFSQQPKIISGNYIIFNLLF